MRCRFLVLRASAEDAVQGFYGDLVRREAVKRADAYARFSFRRLKTFSLTNGGQGRRKSAAAAWSCCRPPFIRLHSTFNTPTDGN